MTEEVYTYKQVAQYDPTHTTVLRNAFAAQMGQRFDELIAVIRQAVVTNDCFGLKEQKILTQQMTPPPYPAFVFLRDPEKVEAFMRWLQEQVDKGILQIGTFQQIGSAMEQAWTNMYVFDSYKRGVIRARYELRKAGVQIPDDAFGGIGVILGLPVHMDRVGLLFTRVFTDLKGITAAMDTMISRVLAQGMIDGDGPALIARKLISVINGEGVDKLGLRDSLGRFIPARVRAKLLARTEIIRAHAEGQLQEFRNWGIEGVSALAEFSTAKDDRVCPVCESLEGKVYTLDEASGVIPVHPQCFIDQQIPIYTSEGWKPIVDVKIGDYVLTHKRRFRKVLALPRHQEKAEVVTFKFKGNLFLSMTSNHPVLLLSKNSNVARWKDAGFCKEGDCLALLGNICKRCGKPIPYFRKYCSRSCISKDVAEKQWANPEHRKIVSKKNRIANLRQYATGERNGKDCTKKAHEKTRLMVIEGTHPFQREDVISNNKKVTNLPKHRKASSERMKKNNPMHDPVIVDKTKQIMQEFYINNPERRLNALMAKHRKSTNMTWIEKRMSELLDKIGVNYIYQYPILNYNVDFAIPGLKIVIECDGEYWHQDKQKDAIRDKRIEGEGWVILHYTGTKINQCLDEIEQELSRVLYNHLGEYNLIGWPVVEVKKWTLKRARTLYNLTVEEDESYIAKGVVVHNCRCCWLPYIEELKKYE